MTNVLEAIFNIVSQNNFKIKRLHSGRNRANDMGRALEKYVMICLQMPFSSKCLIRLYMFQGLKHHYYWRVFDLKLYNNYYVVKNKS